MGRASRLKRERRDDGVVGAIMRDEAIEWAKKHPNQLQSGAVVQLVNPVAEHFESFIVGNAVAWEQLAWDSLVIADPSAARDIRDMAQTDDASAMQRAFHIAIARAGCTHVIEEDSAKGQTLVLCGAGPSLAETIDDYAPKADQLWGANSAAPYLVKRGIKVTHAITVDQTADMLNEWAEPIDVEYLLATTVHPHLVDLLRSQQRRIRFFHNYVGIGRPPVSYDGQMLPYEDWMYAALYATTVRCGSGLNTTTRAIDAALYAGFEKVYVLGADCALRASAPMPKNHDKDSPEYIKWLKEKVVMHADGGHAMTSGATSTTMSGEIDGRLWISKPDMIISAVLMEMARRKTGDRVEYIGDTLPNALRDKPVEFLQKLPHMIGKDGQPMPLE